MRKDITRRQAFIGTGALVAATTGGIALSTNNATATVSGEFAIPNGETVLADQQLQDVRLEVLANWRFQSNAPINGVELELHVGATTETLDLIARYEDRDLGTDELSGETTMNGSLMSASDFSIDDFDADGTELRRQVVAELRMYVIRNEEVVADATQTTTFEVVVKDEALQVDMTLGGAGEVTFETG